MPAGAASDRRRSGYRLAAREVPAPWVAAAAVVALGLLLFAGGGPLRPALATFALGTLAALALTWLHGAAARHRARRRAEAAHAAVMREGLARLRTARRPPPTARVADAGDRRSPHAGAELAADDLLAILAALSGAEPPGPPRSLAALTRSAAAAVRADARDVALVVAVEQDTRVRGAGLEPALRGLLRHAADASPEGATVTAAIRRGRLELRDAAPPSDPFAADLARAVAHRAGGDLHVFDRTDEPGTLTVLELPLAA
jgi:hypothetical protein